MGCKGKIIAIAKCPPGRAATRLHTFLGKSPTLGADVRVQLTAAVSALEAHGSGWVEGANPTESSKKKRSRPSETEGFGEEPKTPEQHKSKKKKKDKEKTVKKNT
mmetsp:Transcript_18587/g.31255  ORF Transcript_18587/g.31255 Transcript_18587/m.31255 type:complete len:105 (-) Transcript_18587:2535-2849(-)